jgi:hypothetical protein
MDKLQPCEMIELHDAGIILTSQTCTDALVGWNYGQDEHGLTYSIEGKDLERLAKHFGIGTYPIRKSNEAQYLEDYTFSLVRKLPDVPDEDKDRWIKTLSARIIAANLLEILVTWAFSDGDLIPVRVTYSGTFTVWWKSIDPDYFPPTPEWLKG